MTVCATWKTYSKVIWILWIFLLPQKRTNEELWCVEKGAGVSRVPRENLQRSNAAQTTNRERAETEHDEDDLCCWRVFSTFPGYFGRLQRWRSDMDHTTEADCSPLWPRRCLFKRNFLRCRWTEQCSGVELRFRLGWSVSNIFIISWSSDSMRLQLRPADWKLATLFTYECSEKSCGRGGDGRIPLRGRRLIRKWIPQFGWIVKKIPIWFVSNKLIWFFFISFDPDQDRWVQIASMKSKRLAVGVAVVNRLVSMTIAFFSPFRLTFSSSIL